MISTNAMFLLFNAMVLVGCFLLIRFRSVRQQESRRTGDFLRRVNRRRVNRHREAELERTNYPEIADDELVKNNARTIIAFPADYLLTRVNIGNMRTTRLQINGISCVGVPISHFNEVCEMAGISPARVTTVETDYEGVSFVQVSSNDKTIGFKTSEEGDLTAALKRKYTEISGYNRKKAVMDASKRKEIKLQSTIERYQRQLVSSLRELEETQKQLQAVQSIDESSLDRSGNEFDHLINHPDVEKVDIVDNKLMVYTAPISINYQDIEYDIGRFRITIHINGAKGGVTMKNLTRTVRVRGIDDRELGHDHPHIIRGIPCLGNIQEVIPHLIAERKYPALVSVCIQYLKSYNDSDGGSPNINNWPRTRK